MHTIAKEQVFEIVRREITRICAEQTPDFKTDIRPESSLVADIGLDSISMVEALVAIEQALGIHELSLAAWTDEELERDGTRFTVGSLVDLCLQRTSAASLAD